jgi:GNAT superfamily N-acetyltransferase
VRTYVEPSPAGGYFVRLSGEPAPVSRHDTEEEAEAAAAAYARGLARSDAADHVVLGDREVEIRPAAGVDHLDVEAIEATAGGEVVGRARYVRSGERLHVAELTVEVQPAWAGLETRLLRRLSERARENGVRVFATPDGEVDVA